MVPRHRAFWVFVVASLVCAVLGGGAAGLLLWVLGMPVLFTIATAVVRYSRERRERDRHDDEVTQALHRMAGASPHSLWGTLDEYHAARQAVAEAMDLKAAQARKEQMDKAAHALARQDSSIMSDVEWASLARLWAAQPLTNRVGGTRRTDSRAGTPAQ